MDKKFTVTLADVLTGPREIQITGDAFDATPGVLRILKGGSTIAAFNGWVSIIEVQAPTE